MNIIRWTIEIINWTKKLTWKGRFIAMACFLLTSLAAGAAATVIIYKEEITQYIRTLFVQEAVKSSVRAIVYTSEHRKEAQEKQKNYHEKGEKWRRFEINSDVPDVFLTGLSCDKTFNPTADHDVTDTPKGNFMSQEKTVIFDNKLEFHSKARDNEEGYLQIVFTLTCTPK